MLSATNSSTTIFLALFNRLCSAATSRSGDARETAWLFPTGETARPLGMIWKRLLNISKVVAKDIEESLTRKEAVTLHQIRVGKLPHMKKFLFSICQSDSPICNACDSAHESPNHLLFECPAHDQLRWKQLGHPPYNRQEIITDNPTPWLVFLNTKCIRTHKAGLD